MQRGRHIAGGDPARKAFDHRGFTHARLAGQDGVVLAPAHEDVHDLANLIVATDDRIDLSLARLLGEVDCEALQRLLFAELCRR